VLRLPENPTTGYRWAGDPPAFLSLTRDDNAPGDAPGAAGVRVLEFVAAAPGRGELTLACTRAWDPAAPAMERFNVTIVVE
jgi:inhibitor of cysteine peptidase